MEKEKEIEGESSDIEQKISKPKENMVKNQRKNKKHNKKTKHKKEMEDISDQIQFQLKYENFEEDSDVFQLQLTRKESKIKMDDSSLLDQSHFRFMIKDNSEIMKKYNHIKQHNFKNITWEDIALIYFYCNHDYSCPICLEVNLCSPVIIKCGHIFCYPCLLDMYNYHKKSNNDKPLLCPLCHKEIEINQNDDNYNWYKF
jgi:hypothetical protein